MHDNVWPHCATATRELLQQCWWKTLEYPPDSPYLTLSNYHILPALEDHVVSTDIKVMTTTVVELVGH